MQPLFSGLERVGIDEKRRATIPASFSPATFAAHGQELMVGRLPSGCIAITTRVAWEAEMNKLTAAFEIGVLDDGPKANYLRNVLASFAPAKVTGGKLAIPEALLRWAGLDPRQQKQDSEESTSSARATLLGVGPRAELWSTSRLAATAEFAMESPAGIGMPQPVRTVGTQP